MFVAIVELVCDAEKEILNEHRHQFNAGDSLSSFMQILAVVGGSCRQMFAFRILCAMCMHNMRHRRAVALHRPALHYARMCTELGGTALCCFCCRCGVASHPATRLTGKRHVPTPFASFEHVQ